VFIFDGVSYRHLSRD